MSRVLTIEMMRKAVEMLSRPPLITEPGLRVHSKGATRLGAAP